MFYGINNEKWEQLYTNMFKNIRILILKKITIINQKNTFSAVKFKPSVH